ncbi:hypothetical protein BLOT_014586 [Blomia tropicalis]|nr:hypothetical protein BLOT_014586 [Blomia tropicalis]
MAITPDIDDGIYDSEDFRLLFNSIAATCKAAENTFNINSSISPKCFATFTTSHREYEAYFPNILNPIITRSFNVWSIQILINFIRVYSSHLIQLENFIAFKEYLDNLIWQLPQVIVMFNAIPSSLMYYL